MNKHKKCLIILPSLINNQESIVSRLKVHQIRYIKEQFEQNNLDIALASYKGNKPTLDFGKDDSNRIWVQENEEFLINILNTDNITHSPYDALFILSFSSVYLEVKQSDNKIIHLVNDFHEAKKPICTLGHSAFILAKALDKENTWPFVGYNLTGATLENLLSEGFNNINNETIEELVLTKGGIYVTRESNIPYPLVIIDRNLITGADDNGSFIDCINILLFKLKK